MSRMADDSEELCAEGQELWERHLDYIKESSGVSVYNKYLEHIWSCKRCQKGLGLSQQIIEIQKAQRNGIKLCHG